MRLKWVLMGGAAVGLLAASPSLAAPVVFGEVTIDGEVFEFRTTLEPEPQIEPFVIVDEPGNGNGSENGNGDVKSDDVFSGSVNVGDFQTDNGAITNLTFTNILDPVSNVAFGVTDFGAPSVFALAVFGLAIAPPIPGLALVESSIVATCSDGPDAPVGSCPTAPVAPATHIASYDINGLVLPALDLNPGEVIDTSGAGGIGLGAVFTASTVIDCFALFGAGGCTTMSHAIAFVGPGGGDAVTYNSRLEITGIPEPLTLASFAGGLLALGGMALRRRSSAA